MFREESTKPIIRKLCKKICMHHPGNWTWSANGLSNVTAIYSTRRKLTFLFLQGKKGNVLAWSSQSLDLKIHWATLQSIQKFKMTCKAFGQKFWLTLGCLNPNCKFNFCKKKNKKKICESNVFKRIKLPLLGKQAHLAVWDFYFS